MDGIVRNSPPLTAAALEHYRTRGWVLLDDAVDSADLDAALASLRASESTSVVARSDRYNDAGRVDFQKIPNLARRDAAFRRLATAPVVTAAIEALLEQEPLLFTDVMIIKPARDGAPLDYHQDSAYWDVAPRALVSAWFPFRDVSATDGCLRVIDGSHRRSYPHDILIGQHRALPQWVTAVLRGLASQAGTGDSDASGWAAARSLKNATLGCLTRYISILAKLQDLHARVPADEQLQAADLPMRAGSVLLFHSMLLHASGPNTSHLDRPAYIATYMGATTLSSASESRGSWSCASAIHPCSSP